MADNQVHYAEGYHEIFGDSDSEDDLFDFEGFQDLGPDSGDDITDESESEDNGGDDDDELVQRLNFVPEDPFLNDHNWLNMVAGM